eukprot:XP_011665439.1 PREDICTED: iduronate 2-sulfatase isoform X1 [Strongylocentrotus purpuratus]
MAWTCCRNILIAVAWSIFTSLCIQTTFALDQERPNVLFIVIDDLRPSLGCYGGPIISPNIDQLAAQSAVFTNAMVQQSLCAPSRTSFLTGRRPDTTKLYDFYSYWREAAGNYTTLPQHFKENGYFTASVGKVFHPGNSSGGNDDYPYSWSVPAYHPSTDQFIYAKVCPNLDGKLGDNVMCPVDVDKMPEGTLPDLQAFERAAEILRNLSSAKATGAEKTHLHERFEDGKSSLTNASSPPFFLAVGYRKPHVPWKYPKEYESLYPLSSVEIASNPTMPEEMPSAAWEVFGRLRKHSDLRPLKLPLPYGTIPLNYHGPMRQNYYAASTFMDYQVGRLLNVLEESGFANNTIIVLVGDHGWQLGEHGEWCKFSNFELATRAPLLLHVPGVTDTRWMAADKFELLDPLLLTKKDAVEKRQMNIKLQRYLHKNAIRDVEILGEQERYEFIKDYSDLEHNNGIRVEDFVEFVDIFPTLSDLANISIPPICPPKSFNVDFCAEGVSFAPLITNKMTSTRGDISGGNSNRVTNFTRWKNATFSQYPRPSIVPTGESSDVPHLANITIMGYSMRTRDYHYTEWIGFNHTTFEGNWSDVGARELYINALDPDQNQNVAGYIKYGTLVKDLSQRLQRGWRDCLPN